MNTKTKFELGFCAVLGTLTLAGIGVMAQGQDIPSASPSPSESPDQGPQRQVFIANLNQSSGNAGTGSARIVVDEGRIGVSTQGTGFDPDIPLVQQIYSGTACPTSASDANGDGVIDETEANAVSGTPIVPLTLSGDLQVSSDSSVSAVYPVSSSEGVLNYINAGPLATFGTLPAIGSEAGTASPSASPSPSESPSASPSLSPSVTPPSASPSVSPSADASPNVRPSASPSAAPIVLPADTLGLNGRVIIVKGVSASTPLPGSAQSAESGQTAQQTLPVACGIIRQVAG